MSLSVVNTLARLTVGPSSWFHQSNVIKLEIDLHKFELGRFKVGAFFETRCTLSLYHSATEP